MYIPKTTFVGDRKSKKCIAFVKVLIKPRGADDKCSQMID